jgi:hypothetical protein
MTVDCQKIRILLEDWQQLAKNKFKWRKLDTVTGRANHLYEWHGGTRSIRIKRHPRRTPEAKAYIDKKES